MYPRARAYDSASRRPASPVGRRRGQTPGARARRRGRLPRGPEHRRAAAAPRAGATASVIGTALLILAAGGCDLAGGAGDSARAGADAATPPRRVHPLDERTDRSTIGLHAGLVDSGVARAAELPRLHNMIVARDGRVELERNFRGPGPAVPVNVKSASKSLLSALVGLAIAEGELQGLHQPIASFFPSRLGSDADSIKRTIKVGDLLTMRSGLESTSSGNYGAWVSSSDWVGYALAQPMAAAPGARVIYSTGNTHLLSAILTRATERSTYAYARDRLAEPLGVRIPQWLRSPQGIYFGGNDMRISPRDLLRFGELYRNEGVAPDGTRILPREWVMKSWMIYGHSRRSGHGYGLGWWGRRTNGYAVRFAWGWGGQYLFIVPALELTVVFTSDPVSPRTRGHNSALHDLLDDWLVPAALEGA